MGLVASVVIVVTVVTLVTLVTLVITHVTSHLVSVTRLHSAAIHALTAKLTRTSVHHHSLATHSVHHWVHSHSHAAAHALHHWAHSHRWGTMCHIDLSSLALILAGLLHGMDLLHHLLHALLLSHLEFLEGALLPRPSHILVEPVDVLLDGLVLF